MCKLPEVHEVSLLAAHRTRMESAPFAKQPGSMSGRDLLPRGFKKDRIHKMMPIIL